MQTTQSLDDYFEEWIGKDIRRYREMREQQTADWKKPRNRLELKEFNPDD
jgi:hypothetical protein